MKPSQIPLVSLLVVVLGCGHEERASPPSQLPAAPPPTAKPRATPAPALAPAAPASGCRSLPWKKDEVAGAAVGDATYEGTLESFGGGAAGMSYEGLMLTLDRPVCLPADSDDKETSEIQLGWNDDKLEARLRSLVGRKVVITGDGVKAYSSYHHKPIMIQAKTVSSK